MTQLPLLPRLTTAQRLAMLRAAHRRYLAREHAAERVVRDEAPRGRTWVAADVPEGATVWVQDGRRWRAMVRCGGGR